MPEPPGGPPTFILYSAMGLSVHAVLGATGDVEVFHHQVSSRSLGATRASN